MKIIQEIAEELRNENEKCFKECEGCCCDVENDVCACENAVILSTLEKQMPKKPIKICASKKRFYYSCPNCESRQFSQEKHCHDCGQLLDWNE